MTKNSFLSNLCKKCGNAFFSLSARFESEKPPDRQGTESLKGVTDPIPSQLVKVGRERSLHRTRFGDLFWLNDYSCIDQSIVQTGLWEPRATEVVRAIVKKGHVVLDVGANIGYFTVILSKLVGPEGKVYAFEPATKYYEILKRNLEENEISNCEVFKLGLSDRKQTVGIFEDEASATIHVPEGMPLGNRETISVVALSDFVREHRVKKIDFIKMDVDGHEPLIFQGAWDTLEQYNPVILTEVSQLHFLESGITAWDFYAELKRRGYNIYSEAGLVEIKNRSAFLIECGNYAYSANVFISRRDLPQNDK